jgi:mannosyltransferase
VNRDRTLRAVGPLVGGLTALVLGLYRLGDESLWLDEGVTATLAGGSWSAVVDRTVAYDPHTGLYYSAIKLWSAFGFSEFNLRLLSVLCIAAAAALLAVLAARLFGALAGVVAGVVFATNPFIIRFAQEARAYALAALLTALASLLLVQALDRSSPARWIGWGVATVVLVYVHAVAAAVLVAFLAAIVLHPKRPTTPALVTGGLAIGMALSPLAILMLRADTSSLDWIPEPAVSDIPRSLRDLAGSQSLVVAVAVAAVIATVGAVRRPSERAWPLVFSALLAVVPVVVIFTASYVKPTFLPRYLIVAIPGIVLLVAAGISELRAPALMLAAAAVVVAIAVPRLDDWYSNESKENWRGVAATVAARSRPDDIVVIYPFGHDAFRFYYDEKPILLGGEVLANRLHNQHDRVWIVLYGRRAKDSTAALLAEALESDHPERRQWTFNGLVVRLYSRA